MLIKFCFMHDFNLIDVSSGNTNQGVTRKPDNPIKGIRDPIPRNPDNPLKGIWNLVPNVIWSHWWIGLTVPTYIYINLYNQPLIATCQWHLSRLLLRLQQIR